MVSPPWLRKRAADPLPLEMMGRLVREAGLHLVCEEADCPNQGECFSAGRVTFLILGNICTRSCGYCAVERGCPSPVDSEEPRRLALVAKELGLKQVVVTSVTRDDLEDGGASQFARTIEEVRSALPLSAIEVLIPDFQGHPKALGEVIAASPSIVAHNLETVPRLYPRLRPGASYWRSRALLREVKEMNPRIRTKSGLMLGLGERFDEVVEVMGDLRQGRVDLLTLGQYLAPTPSHYPLSRYITPTEFDCLAQRARLLGFLGVASGPWVRSSLFIL